MFDQNGPTIDDIPHHGDMAGRHRFGPLKHQH
jgi:hypothetical protein